MNASRRWALAAAVWTLGIASASADSDVPHHLVHIEDKGPRTVVVDAIQMRQQVIVGTFFAQGPALQQSLKAWPMRIA